MPRCHFFIYWHWQPLRPHWATLVFIWYPLRRLRLLYCRRLLRRHADATWCHYYLLMMADGANTLMNIYSIAWYWYFHWYADSHYAIDAIIILPLRLLLLPCHAARYFWGHYAIGQIRLRRGRHCYLLMLPLHWDAIDWCCLATHAVAMPAIIFIYYHVFAALCWWYADIYAADYFIDSCFTLPCWLMLSLYLADCFH